MMVVPKMIKYNMKLLMLARKSRQEKIVFSPQHKVKDCL